MDTDETKIEGTEETAAPVAAPEVPVTEENKETEAPTA